ncbi:hypothetical protein PHJA_002075200 [Phtheirospermum japonicum]|uniref:Uncharacterized protein n=1 Tax=Phtheirospermum japonicum TaxID=374723 RepID=A0A830CYU8_9LAMI|nr:hypothetical protein PHJA_002075200 [Phtheirospermum japonicum]
MELDFDKYCVVDGSPTTVLPSPRRRSKPAYKKLNEKLKYEKNYIPSLSENFAEISFNRYRSASCKDARPKRSNHELPKRGSVYQSSKEVNFMSKADSIVRREKIELSRESASKTSHFGIIDSLCSLDEDSPLDERNRSSVASTSAQSTYSINYSFSSKSEKLSLNKPSVNLHKSLSAKLALPHSPARPRPHISPDKIGPDFENETIRKSENNSVSLSSPAHLQGILKTENKNGVPFFEFSVKSPEDVCYVAKTWKVDNALTWVYTFHSLHNKRKSNASGWGFKDHNNRESSMVGQMVMSCYLCTELKGAGAFNDSMVTEYVLYDIAQSRRSVSSQDNASCSPDITKVPLLSDCEKSNKGRIINHSQPMAVSELRPELETAAIIMRAPFEKRESLKFKSGDSKMDLCRVEGTKGGIYDNSSRGGTMHVVVPAGNHSLPSVESRGPSPLLDRWRLGGGCDCGGWDMACPLDVFGNPNFRVAEGQPLMMDGRDPAKLFVQGRKDNDVPAFTMRAIEEGKYAVDFHAQLSSLQAFAVCVSILHAAEASTSVGHEQSKQMLQSDSLRVFAEEEIKNLIDAISEEDKILKGSYNKKEEVLAPSFVLNPPFSPIGRV